MGPATAGASLSGEEKAEALLCRLSFEDFGLRACVDMIVKLRFRLCERYALVLGKYMVFMLLYRLWQMWS
jgi:hypothetical protein